MFAAAPLTPQAQAEAEARKWCADYELPASVCTALIQCIKEGRSWESCLRAVITAAATAGCAAVLPGVATSLAPACGAFAAWIASSVTDFVSDIFDEGCRYGFGPDLRRVKLGWVDKNVGRDVSRAADATLIPMLNRGEFVTRGLDWQKSVPIRGLMTFVISGDDCTAGPSDLHLLRDLVYPQPHWRGAVKDWDGRGYVIGRSEDSKHGQLILSAPPPPPPPTYSPGALAIFDGAINQYRIVEPL